MRRTLFPLLVAIAWVISGCASGPEYKLSQDEAARYADIPAETAVNNAKAALIKAREEGVQSYAPATFAKAQEALDKASKRLGDKADKEEVVSLVGLTEKQLKSAYEVKGTVLRVLGPVIELDRRLKELGAPEMYKEEYGVLQAAYRKHVAAIEAGTVTEVEKEAPKLKGSMEALKIRAIKQNALGPAQKQLAALTAQRASQYAPVAVKQAEEIYQKCDAAIQTAPDDVKKVGEAGELALAAGKRAEYVAARVQATYQKEYPILEKEVLDEEARLAAVAEPLGAAGLMGLPFDQQVSVIAAKARALLAELAKATEEQRALGEQVKAREGAVSATQSSLEQERQKARDENERLNVALKEAAATMAGLNQEKALLEGKISVLEQRNAVMEERAAAQQQQIQVLKETITAMARVTSQPVQSAPPAVVAPAAPLENATPPAPAESPAVPE